MLQSAIILSYSFGISKEMRQVTDGLIGRFSPTSLVMDTMEHFLLVDLKRSNLKLETLLIEPIIS